ncbi:hypothetical protein GCM10028807_17170 [Spirosoma daeguense]
MSLLSGKKFIFWAKTAVFAGLVLYIGYVIRQQYVDWHLVAALLRSVRYPERWFIGLFLLTPINWGFEALKWQILLRRIENTTFKEAYRGVLVGVSLGFALPAQLGDTAGRVLSLRTNRAKAIGASMVSGGMQFYVALVFGTIAWGYYLKAAPERSNSASNWLLAVLITLSMGGILFGLLRRQLVRWLENRTRFKRFSEYWNVAGLYSDTEIIQALSMAAIRYVIFSVQFYLAMRLTGIDLPLNVAASGIGVVFLVKTITPAFNLLSDLGVREAAALWVFSPFDIPAPILLTATLTLWVANLLTPVLIGLIWVWKLKISR